MKTTANNQVSSQACTVCRFGCLERNSNKLGGENRDPIFDRDCCPLYPRKLKRSTFRRFITIWLLNLGLMSIPACIDPRLTHLDLDEWKRSETIPEPWDDMSRPAYDRDAWRSSGPKSLGNPQPIHLCGDL